MVMVFVAMKGMEAIVYHLMIICLNQVVLSVTKSKQFLMLDLQVQRLRQLQYQHVEAQEFLAYWVMNVVVADARLMSVHLFLHSMHLICFIGALVHIFLGIPYR
jgi:hypothetical protein